MTESFFSRAHSTRLTAAALLGLMLLLAPAMAESPAQVRERINENTVSILSGNANGTYLYIAGDIAFVLDDGDKMRVLPIVGKGGAQNVRDLIYLRGIDMAIVRSDALETFKDDPAFRNLGDQIRYIARLYNEEMHILARKDIKSLQDLDGRKVNFSDVGSGTQLTSKILFEKVGVAPIELNMGQRDAFEAMKAGEIDATILVAGKPAKSFADLDIDKEKFHILPVKWEGELQKDYLPTRLSSDEYPNLLDDGESVETIAVGAILAAYNWKKGSARYERIGRFVDAFFSKFEDFRSPARHSKWQETNIAAEVPGWTRFEPAQKWLDQNLSLASGESAEEDEKRREFSAFLRQTSQSSLPESKERELFQQFMEWREGQTSESKSR